MSRSARNTNTGSTDGPRLRCRVSPLRPGHETRGKALDADEILLGRGAAATVALQGPAAADVHVRLTRVTGGYALECAAYAGDTWLDGESVPEGKQVLLSDSHVLRVGEEQVLLEVDDGLVGRGQASQALRRLILRYARGRMAVLIEGETGVGKDVVARALHARGDRQRMPFISVNCGAIPESLAESELFGHVRGAFTGATAQRDGRFGSADGGTLFLNEIGELALTTQAKILTAVEDGEITRVGADRAEHVDVRVIAATNRDLRSMVRDGTFREDLFQRLKSARIKVPSLRERKDDIPLLTEHFLARFRHPNTDLPAGVEAAAVAALEAYHWPGNVRELRSAIEVACVEASNCQFIAPRHLPQDVVTGRASEAVVPTRRGGSISPGQVVRIEELPFLLVYALLLRHLERDLALLFGTPASAARFRLSAAIGWVSRSAFRDRAQGLMYLWERDPARRFSASLDGVPGWAGCQEPDVLAPLLSEALRAQDVFDYDRFRQELLPVLLRNHQNLASPEASPARAPAVSRPHKTGCEIRMALAGHPRAHGLQDARESNEASGREVWTIPSSTCIGADSTHEGSLLETIAFLASRNSLRADELRDVLRDADAPVLLIEGFRPPGEGAQEAWREWLRYLRLLGTVTQVIWGQSVDPLHGGRGRNFGSVEIKYCGAAPDDESTLDLDGIAAELCPCCRETLRSGRFDSGSACVSAMELAGLLIPDADGHLALRYPALREQLVKGE
jgi:transcriptional regulator with AAA-type ATPase domain